MAFAAGIECQGNRSNQYTCARYRYASSIANHAWWDRNPNRYRDDSAPGTETTLAHRSAHGHRCTSSYICNTASSSYGAVTTRLSIRVEPPVNNVQGYLFSGA